MQKPLPNTLSIVLLLILLTLGGQKSYGITPIVHIAPKPTWISTCKPYDKKPSERSIADGAYDELVEEQINIEQKATYNHFITQIVSESGVQNNSEVSASFNPAYERLDFHEIIVWRNGKPQSRLNQAAFKVLAQEDEFEKFIYNGTYSAKLILWDIRKGDKIEYSYTITGRNPIFGDKFCRTVYLQGSGLIAHMYTTLLFSANRQVNIKSFNQLSPPKITTIGGLKRYEWEDYQMPGVISYKNQPSWLNLYSQVQVSDYATWAEVANWGARINPVQTRFTGDLAETIARLKSEAGIDKQKYFRAAVCLVQNEVRYMGIETGPYSNKANDPDKVFKNRYGDCKDKSLLLASILKADAIDANIAFVSTEIGSKLMDFLPSEALFNHAVVVAVMNGKPVWVDATMDMQGGKGTDIYFPSYGYGLILKQSTTGLAKILPSPAGKINYEERYTATEETAPVYLKSTTTYTLNEADDMRSYYASKSKAEIEKANLDYYSKKYNKIEATDTLIIKDNREKNIMVVTENYKISSNFFKLDSINGKYNTDFYASFISRQLPEVAGNVKNPVSVNYPFNVDEKIIVDMENGWDIEDEQDSVYRSAYRFKFNKTVKNDRLTLHYQFKYLKEDIPATELNQFRQDVKDLKADKLYFTFYSTPNVDRVPFAFNRMMVIMGVVIAFLCAFIGLRIYRTETTEHGYYTRDNIGPALGGWLWVLVLTLVGTAISFVGYLREGDYFSTRQWDFFLTGADSIKNRALIVFEAVSYTALLCYALFCLFLIFKKRDIAPWLTKIFYASCVVFLFIDCFFRAYMLGHSLSNYAIEQVIEAVMAAVIWTYYLNTSTRVEDTFVVPYPD